MENENIEATEGVEDNEVKSNKKRCPNCQALVVETQAFCTECGTSLKKTCDKCGMELIQGQAFCSKCGAKQNESPDLSQGTLNDNGIFEEQRQKQSVSNSLKSITKKKVAMFAIIPVVAIALIVFIIIAMQPSAFEKDLKHERELVLANAEMVGLPYSSNANVAEAKRNRESLFIWSCIDFLNLAEEYPEEATKVSEEYELLIREINRRFPEAAKLLN